MKVGDLLSGPTIVSSRALTIYSGTVLAVMWTDTTLTKLPGIGWLGETDHTRYVIMFMVLLFMLASHIANWMNDQYAVAERYAYSRFNSSNPPSEEMGVHAHLRKHGHKTDNSPQAKNTAKALRAVWLSKIRKLLNTTIRNGFHLGVPCVLALTAGVTLALKIFPETFGQ